MTLLQQLDPIIQDQMRLWDVPGVAVGILHDGQVEFAGHGVANIETGAPVAPETLFQVGSISKVFTATLLMTLVDEGRVDIEAPIVRYVSELVLADPDARDAITVRHLLTHMGGFYGDRFDPHGEGDDALARAVAALADLPQQTAPGELWTYCNAGIDLLGRAIEKLLEMPFEAAMRERVFEPLRLERSTYFAYEAILHAVAVGHGGGGPEPVHVVSPWPVPRRTNPAGGVVSNVLELIRFAACHLNDGAIGPMRLISRESAIAMRTIQTEADYGRAWGFGWLKRRLNGTQTVEHGGATNGFTARLLTVPDHTFAIAILTNSDNGGTVHSAIAAEALDRFLGLRAEGPAPIELDRAQLERFVGHFRHGLADIEVRLDDQGLVMHRVSHEPFRREDTTFPPARLKPISDSEWMVTEGLFEGAVGELIVNGDGTHRFLRMGGRLGYPV
jgi:CubicO group peptidase (beta-lactamase class C family)